MKWYSATAPVIEFGSEPEACINSGGTVDKENDGAELASTYEGLVAIGFDAGEAQKAAGRAGYFLGSITQDPYRIGYLAVELACRASQGETVSDVDTGAKFYNADNMDQEDIGILLYD